MTEGCVQDKTASTEPDRHSRKCSICRHPHRDAIEEEFLHWHRVVWIAREYDVPDHRSIHRHARAVGLVTARRENLHSALDNIVEQSDGIRASASDVLKAMRAYSCLDAATGRWTDLPQPPRHLIYSNASRGTDNLVCAGLDSTATGGPLPVSPQQKSGGVEENPTNQHSDMSFQTLAPSSGAAEESAVPSDIATAPNDDPTDPASPNYIEQGPPPLIGPPVIRIRPNPLKTKDRQHV